MIPTAVPKGTTSQLICPVVSLVSLLLLTLYSKWWPEPQPQLCSYNSNIQARKGGPFLNMNLFEVMGACFIVLWPSGTPTCYPNLEASPFRDSLGSPLLPEAGSWPSESCPSLHPFPTPGTPGSGFALTPHSKSTRGHWNQEEPVAEAKPGTKVFPQLPPTLFMASRSSSFLISQNWKRPQESLGPSCSNTFLFHKEKKKHGVLPPRVQAGSQGQDRAGTVLHGTETPALGRDLGSRAPEAQFQHL